MLDFSSIRQVLADWSLVVERPDRPDLHDWELDYYVPELAAVLRSEDDLVDIAQKPFPELEAIAEAVWDMSDQQFLWLLPVLLWYGCLSEDCGASLISHAMREKLPTSQLWHQVKSRLAKETLRWVQTKSRKIIPDSSCIRNVFDDWSSVVERPPPPARRGEEGCDWNLEDECPEFVAALRNGEHLVDIAEMPSGDTSGFVFMSEDQFVWILPVLVLHGYVSLDYDASSVVNAIHKRLSVSRRWAEVKPRLASETMRWLRSMSKKLVQLGWQDERRIAKRMAECMAVFS